MSYRVKPGHSESVGPRFDDSAGRSLCFVFEAFRDGRASVHSSPTDDLLGRWTRWSGPYLLVRIPKRGVPLDETALRNVCFVGDDRTHRFSSVDFHPCPLVNPCLNLQSPKYNSQVVYYMIYIYILSIPYLSFVRNGRKPLW